MPEKTVSLECFVELAKDQSLLFIVAFTQRPGVTGFLVDLETNYFPPGCPKNDLFQLGIMKWEELEWAVMWVPMEFKDLVWEVAAKNKMRIADGIPTMLSSEGKVTFPLDGRNVFTLENVTGSQIYEGLEGQKKAHAADLNKADAIIGQFKVRN